MPGVLFWVIQVEILSKMQVTAILVLFISQALVYSARILAVFPFPSISHQKPFISLAEELSRRGHTITVITPNPNKDQSLRNLTEIDVSDIYPSSPSLLLDDSLSSESSIWHTTIFLKHFLQVVAEGVLQTKQVQNLIKGINNIDLVIVESHFPVFFAFGHKFNAPMISISSLGSLLDVHDAVGNPTHPVISPEILKYLSGSLETSFLQRLDSFLYNFWYRAYYSWVIIPRLNKVANTYFGGNIPSIKDLQSKVSLVFTTVNPIVDTVRPNLPNVINIEQLHIRKPKPLPKGIKEFLDEASQGAVYFSFGTNVNIDQIGNGTLKNIYRDLATLPYKVLWKLNPGHFPKRSKNIMTKNWFPQQDILGHPNIKVFITQGGLQSIEESIHSAVPMVGIPFIVDQPRNVANLEKWGIGIALDRKELTTEKLTKTILQVATNPNFKKNILRAKSIIEDQPLIGVEKAIWWIEYVLRHNGTEHFRYPGADMPLYKYFMLDVISFIIGVISVAVYGIFKMLYTIRSILCYHKSKTE